MCVFAPTGASLKIWVVPRTKSSSSRAMRSLTPFSRPFRPDSGDGLDLLVPPVVEARHWEDGDPHPLRVIVESEMSLREALPEGEDVGVNRGLLQRDHHRFGILDIVIPLVFEVNDPYQSGQQGICLAADLETVESRELSINQRLLGKDAHAPWGPLDSRSPTSGDSS